MISSQNIVQGLLELLLNSISPWSILQKCQTKKTEMRCIHLSQNLWRYATCIHFLDRHWTKDKLQSGLWTRMSIWVSFGVALSTVAALLSDPTFYNQPKNCHFGQVFGCLQYVGSGNNTATADSSTPKHCSKSWTNSNRHTSPQAWGQNGTDHRQIKYHNFLSFPTFFSSKVPILGYTFIPRQCHF